MKIKSKLLISIGTGIGLMACQTERPSEPEAGKETPLPSHLEAIRELGFRTDMVEDLGDSYLVEGCIVFSKAEIGTAGLQKRTQQRTPALVSQERVRSITVRIDATMPTAGVDNWRPEIERAISEWNVLPNSSVRLVPVTAEAADINILPDGGGLFDNVLAAAEFPTGTGAPGWRIQVNLDFSSNSTVTTGQKLNAMVHEIGHCLGFRHTNWQASEPQMGSTTVPYTPATDAASVMNGGTARREWAGFSMNDRLAASILYPEVLTMSPSFYLGYHEDVRNVYGGTNSDGASFHWFRHGQAEGRVGSPAFDAQYYLQAHPDVRAYFGAGNWEGAAIHWTNNGLTEGRASSPAFDVAYYLGLHADLRNVFGPTNYQAAALHWIQNGLAEGRRSAPGFDVAWYLANNPDVRAAVGAGNYVGALNHWLRFGIAEGRRGAP